MEIRETSFEKILPIWTDHLWPGRHSVIEPISRLKFLGGYDRTVENREPRFFVAYEEGQVIGVNSCLRTGPTEFRSRGLFVFPQHRHRGVASLLLEASCAVARERGATSIWSAAREGAVAAYRRVGFSVVSPAIHKDFEFGPNYFVSKELCE